MTRMQTARAAIRPLTLCIAAAAACALISTAPAAAESLAAGYQLRVFAAGGSAMTNPDDITALHGDIFVAYQNESQPDGSNGASSTIVEYGPGGAELASWSVTGHCDGLTADPARRRVIATVNEDADSSLYTIDPGRWGETLHHYTYSPDPTTLSGGGTDAISIVDGRILISASNPSPSTPGGSTFTGPAVYAADIPLWGDVATLTPAFYDDSPAVDAATGQPVTLNLSDPDSSAAVPWSSPRFAGEFMLDSQGDSALIFDRTRGRGWGPGGGWGRGDGSLTRLSLTSAAGTPQVDDVRWTTRPDGALFLVDAARDQIDEITGPFPAGVAITAIDDDSPALASDLGVIHLSTGNVQPVATGFGSPKGILYLPSRHGGHRAGLVRTAIGPARPRPLRVGAR